MYDCHSHILPGFDDGADCLETSLAMLRYAEAHGTTTLLATPHVIEGNWFPSWERITGECATLSQAARDAGIDIVILPGAELALNYDLLSYLKGPGPYCLNGSRYLLVELPSMEIPSYTGDFFFTLQTRGITPVLAHPERHQAIVSQPQILVEWVRKGIMVQMNGPSLLGKMGEKVKLTAELLLKIQVVHCIGSDAHGVEHRRPVLDETEQKLKDYLGQETTDLLMNIIPGQIIMNNEVTLPKPEDVYSFAGGKKQHWFARIFQH